MAKASKSKKYVYTWGTKKADGDGSMKALLGDRLSDPRRAVDLQVALLAHRLLV